MQQHQQQQQYHQQQQQYSSQQYQQQQSATPPPPIVQYPGPPQPVGEAGGASAAGVYAGGTSAGAGGLRVGPSLIPDNVKMDKPLRFSGKHHELGNFLFAMRSYIASVNLTGQNASRFFVSFLTGDALTWWRQYCQTHGGIDQVFSQVTLSDIMDELKEQFTDVDEQLRIRS